MLFTLLLRILMLPHHSPLLFSYCRKILSTITDENGVDLSLCQVVLLSQPDVLPNLSRQAAEFANQSILILSPTRHNASTETVSTRLAITLYCCIFKQ